LGWVTVKTGSGDELGKQTPARTSDGILSRISLQAVRYNPLPW
jgi:hypothetical protein